MKHYVAKVHYSI